ncbi:hypothetical protein CRUP_032610 [Coryphaenoides rupestris]|nr:hypothetical protein CRUP_032610 [Coryphaenoides rupestris]
MGIQGLLQFIKDASEPVHVKKYRGQTVAVDTYCWLHKGAFSCAEKLAKGEPTDQYVTYCMKFVDMLLSFGVKPILVFDGCNLPSKKEVEKSRRERRQANLQKGKQLLREGKISEARDCFTKSINVGLAQAVITEDSDLLAFGCKKVLLKMDREGNGLEIDQAHLGRCRSLGGVFTEEKFRHMCILSGCDYLASLYGVGLGKACKLLKMANNPDILTVIRKMGQYLKMSVAVPEEYLEGFVKADNTFLYQLVFDPLRRKVVPLNPYPEHLDLSTLSYAGLNKGDESGYQMALGNLDLYSLERIDDFDPDRPARPPAVKPRSRRWGDPAGPARPGGTSSSIWSRGYAAGATSTTAGVKEEQHPRPPSTRGQERVVAVGLRGLRLPSRELGAKRPRDGESFLRPVPPVRWMETGTSCPRDPPLNTPPPLPDSSVSDQDVLQLYSSTPGLKRARSREQEEKPSLPRPAGGSSGAAPRNRFATLLQRRNQGGEGDGQTTRSRRGRGHSQQVVHKEEEDEEDEEQDSPPASPPSQDSAYFSQSQPCCDLTSCEADEAADATGPAASSHLSSPWQPEDAAEADSGAKGSDRSPTHDPRDPKRSPVVVVRTLVAGLPRSRPSNQGAEPPAKLRPVAPARASGLRRRPSGSQGPAGKKSPNNENSSPGMQATISSLWKNFGFKRQSSHLDPTLDV